MGTYRINTALTLVIVAVKRVIPCASFAGLLPAGGGRPGAVPQGCQRPDAGVPGRDEPLQRGGQHREGKILCQD